MRSFDEAGANDAALVEADGGDGGVVEVDGERELVVRGPQEGQEEQRVEVAGRVDHDQLEAPCIRPKRSD